MQHVGTGFRAGVMGIPCLIQGTLLPTITGAEGKPLQDGSLPSPMDSPLPLKETILQGEGRREGAEVSDFLLGLSWAALGAWPASQLWERYASELGGSPLTEMSSLFLGGSQPSPYLFSLLVFSGSFHLTH